MKRQNNIEVLRVICMFLIVVSHYIYHGLKENPIAHELGFLIIHSWNFII